jgi:hypothetical protein
VKRLDAWLTLNRMFWLFPVIFLIHDGEELLVMEQWLKEHQSVGYGRIQQFLSTGFIENVSWTTSSFAIAMTMLFIIISLGSYLATRERRKLGLFVIMLTIAYLNVFTHTAQTILIGGYTPGVVTAWIVLLPYTLFVYWRLNAANLLTTRLTSTVSVIGLIVMIAAIFVRLI